MTVRVDPAMATILERIRAAGTPDWTKLDIGVARRLFNEQQSSWTWCPSPMAATTDLLIGGQAGPIRARLYRPSLDPNLPILVFAHGGGWTFGSVDSHGGTMQLLAAHSGMAVLGFDYRLGPEHPFPAPLDDMLAVLSFIEDGGLGPVCDPERIAVAGDSAGANLALGAMLHRRDGGGRMPSTAALFYGCYGPVFDTDSHRRLGSGDWLLSTERMRWYWSNFLGQTAADHPIAAPLRADCAGLPPLYLSAAALDPLVDDTTMLAMRLAAAGVRYRLDVWPGVVHGFLRFARELPMANQAIAAAATFVVDVFKQEAK